MSTPLIEEFRKKFHRYTMDDPRHVMIEEMSGEIEEFLSADRTRLIEKVEGKKHVLSDDDFCPVCRSFECFQNSALSSVLSLLREDNIK